MKKDDNKKQVSRLTGALLARKGSAAPSSATLSLHQPAINRFAGPSGTPQENSYDSVETAAPHMPLEQAIETVKKVTHRQKANRPEEEVVSEQVSVPGKADTPPQQTPAIKQPSVQRKGKTAARKETFTKPTAEAAVQKRIAMTLRMEEDSHLKLRLFSAHTRKSCQVILSEALDMYLEEMGDAVPQKSFASQQG